MKKPVLIIAEAGVNHNGEIKKAYELIEKASYAGADVIKFQTFEADKLLTDSAKKADYQVVNTSKEESQHEMIKNLELSKEDHYKLIEHCKKFDIEFFSSAFDLDSLSFLQELNLSRFKVPSGELTNLPYLRQMGSYKKPIILSTGMSDLLDIKNALDALEVSGMHKHMITVLHCNTEYPVPKGEVNLNAMLTIQREFDVEIGFSDHTSGIEISIAAVALGATIIEKHITLDCSLPGPDHSASIEPNEFKNMVTSIRNIEIAMGNGVKEPSEKEKANMLVARKSIVASKRIVKGTIFSNENITCKRPGEGLSPMQIDKVIGFVARKDFNLNDYISL
jgi:N,N'-diacetyllegionaminate synthase